MPSPGMVAMRYVFTACLRRLGYCVGGDIRVHPRRASSILRALRRQVGARLGARHGLAMRIAEAFELVSDANAGLARRQPVPGAASANGPERSRARRWRMHSLVFAELSERIFVTAQTSAGCQNLRSTCTRSPRARLSATSQNERSMMPCPSRAHCLITSP